MTSTDTPTIPGFNVPLALRQLGGNMKLYIKLLDKFEKSYESAATEISGYISANDYETAERTAHTIKGLAGSLGATNLQEVSAALEKVCKARPPAAETEAPIAAFAREIEATINAIRGFLAEQDGASPAPSAAGAVNKALLGTQLADLARHVDDSDARALMLFDEMRPHLNSFDAAAAGKIGEAFEMFDFTAAAEIIATLRARLV